MSVWSFYEKTTGLFTGRRLSCRHREDVKLNTPRGCRALLGSHDHLSVRIDLATGKLVDYQPPAPDGEHVWNPSVKRWALPPEIAQRRAEREQAATDAEALDRAQARAVREFLLSLDGGSHAARARLQAIEDKIASLPLRQSSVSNESPSPQE